MEQRDQGALGGMAEIQARDLKEEVLGDADIKGLTWAGFWLLPCSKG